MCGAAGQKNTSDFFKQSLFSAKMQNQLTKKIKNLKWTKQESESVNKHKCQNSINQTDLLTKNKGNLNTGWSEQLQEGLILNTNSYWALSWNKQKQTYY